MIADELEGAADTHRTHVMFRLAPPPGGEAKAKRPAERRVILTETV